MNAWFPVSACTPDCMADPAPRAGRVARARRWTGLSGVLAGAPIPRRRGGPRAAERVLTALGVTVEVVPPAVPWPSAGAGRLVAANHVSWLDDVALLALMPGIRPVAKAELAGWPVVGGAARRAGAVFLDRASLRSLPASVTEVGAILAGGESVLVHPEGTTTCGTELGRFRPAFFQAAVDAAAPVCPVALRYRVGDGRGTAVAGYVGAESLVESVRRVVGTAGLVLEVHQLPALQPGTDRRELAALVEYMIAGVTETRPAFVTAHPRPTRRTAGRAASDLVSP